jgi:predicted RNA binding protein YcfA (HicA-like mRNA interferase family)
MFARLPSVRAKHLLAALQKAGFDVIRQKDSHITLHNPRADRTVLVPMHPGELQRWLLKKIIKDAGLDEDEFRSLI